MNNPSQRLAIQRFMASGKAITPELAYRICGSHNLSQRISEVKRQFSVAVRMVTVGKKKRVAEYWMPAARDRTRAMCVS